MKINDREVRFAYTTGAHCDFSDWVVTHQDSSGAHAQVVKAVMMHKAFLEMTGDKTTPALTEKEVRGLPLYEFKQLIEEMKAAEARDSERTVEVDEGAGKKGKAAGMK